MSYSENVESSSEKRNVSPEQITRAVFTKRCTAGNGVLHESQWCAA